VARIFTVLLHRDLSHTVPALLLLRTDEYKKTFALQNIFSMKKNLLVLVGTFVMFVAFISCKKDPGSGGTSTVKGKVWVRQYDPGFSAVLSQYAGADQTVYIIYGDEVNYGATQKANYNGEFEFQYLRNGKYKIYIYSADSAGTVGPPANPLAPKKAIVKEVEITKRKQTVDAGTLVVLKN